MVLCENINVRVGLSGHFPEQYSYRVKCPESTASAWAYDDGHGTGTIKNISGWKKRAVQLEKTMKFKSLWRWGPKPVLIRICSKQKHVISAVEFIHHVLPRLNFSCIFPEHVWHRWSTCCDLHTWKLKQLSSGGSAAPPKLHSNRSGLPSVVFRQLRAIPSSR